MDLTTAQRTALKAYVTATPALDALRVAQDWGTLAEALNAQHAPDFWVWRTRVTKNEYMAGLGPEGTSFNWTGAGYITRSVGERDAWREIFNHTGNVNPALTSVRQAFADIFSGGTQPAPANRAHLTAVSRRKATVAEKALASGTGDTANPATMGAGAEGEMSIDEVIRACE